MTLLTPETIGIPAFIILTMGTAFITALMKGGLRLGREYQQLEVYAKQMKDERDFALSRLERGVRIAETATSLAERAIPPSS
jgi:hypothetical protein